MKKLDTSKIIEGQRRLGGNKATLDHIMEAVSEGIEYLARGKTAATIGEDDVMVIFGVVNAGTGQDYDISAGALFYQGEIFQIPAYEETLAIGQVPVLGLNEEWRDTDPVPYSDGTDQNTHQIRTMFWASGTSGDGILDFADLIRPGDTFDSDIVVSLADGKTFGRYEHGDTIPSTGLTAKQVVLLATSEYVNPVFTSFTISGQATTVEVGTTLSGSKTFLWAIVEGSGDVDFIDVYDITNAANVLTNTANDGTQASAITSGQLNSNGATRSFRGVLHDIEEVQDINSSAFTVTARYYRFYGPAAATPADSTAVRALPSSAFQLSGAEFNLETGSVQTKFFVALPPGVTITEVLDLDALNVNITANYVLQGTITVLDAGGTGRSYNLYKMEIGTPYSSSHRHQITTS